ncbi:TOBE domain-containing protein [Gorillibacterium timonense]|uniref:TOBE domain-containing protein n=1 Tax=Gorillibacterium timonense TaxID=1689269 RepID=UPI00071D9749|nr:TOBE domain-containing protein [Gorillibacterium timonense]
MKLSARNQLSGKVLEVQKGQVNAKVILEIAGGERLTSIISLDAAEELELTEGKEVTAVIKSSSILLMTE